MSCSQSVIRPKRTVSASNDQRYIHPVQLQVAHAFISLASKQRGCEQWSVSAMALLTSLDTKFQLPVSLELMTERPSLR